MSNPSTPEKRRRHREYCEAVYLAWDAYTNGSNPGMDIPERPADLIDLECSAKTRSGKPCKMKNLSLGWSGRCKFHGGDSTGPKTKKGKKRSALNGFQPKAKRTS